ncbi:MAG: hypothetical protein Q7S69_01230 [Nitrosomonadaceae bacterium]|nr:hypothetical protein [Nitrosomonadaceae bacterium]
MPVGMPLSAGVQEGLCVMFYAAAMPENAHLEYLSIRLDEGGE